MWDVAVKVVVEEDGVGGDVWLEPQPRVLPQQDSGDVLVEVVEAELHLPHFLRPHVCADGEACCPFQQRSCHNRDRHVGGLLNVSAYVRRGVPCT